MKRETKKLVHFKSRRKLGSIIGSWATVVSCTGSDPRSLWSIDLPIWGKWQILSDLLQYPLSRVRVPTSRKVCYIVKDLIQNYEEIFEVVGYNLKQIVYSASRQAQPHWMKWKVLQTLFNNKQLWSTQRCVIRYRLGFVCSLTISRTDSFESTVTHTGSQPSGFTPSQSTNDWTFCGSKLRIQ